MTLVHVGYFCAVCINAIIAHYKIGAWPPSQKKEQETVGFLMYV